MSRLRAGLRLLGFVGLTLPLMPLQQIFLWTWPSMGRRFPYHFHRLLCRILGFTVEIIGTPPTSGPVLIASNHVSWIDIVVLSAALPVSFIAKREVAGWPLFGTLARLQQTVFVDRERRHQTASKRDELQERLSSGDILVLFPEGTSGDGASVKPFKSAFFAAATDPGVNIVPVSLAYTHSWNMPLSRRNRPQFAWYGDMDLAPHLWEALATGPLTVKVIFHEELAIETGRNRKQAAREAEDAVRQGLATALHGREILR